MAIWGEQFWSGPFPRPVDLEHYRAIDSELVTTIIDIARAEVDMAKIQQEHDNKIEVMDMDHTINEDKAIRREAASLASRAQIFAIIVALSFLAGAVYLIENGHDVAGATLVAAPLAALVATFLKYSRQQSPEEE